MHCTSDLKKIKMNFELYVRLKFQPQIFYQIYGKVKIGKINSKPVKYYKSCRIFSNTIWISLNQLTHETTNQEQANDINKIITSHSHFFGFKEIACEAIAL